MPQPGDLLLGGHAILIRGWKKINNVAYWVLVNSWGVNVGDNGLFYLPVGYSIDEAWMITEDQPVPGPEPTPVPELPLTVTTTSLPNGTINTPYSAKLAASGGEAPYAWSLQQYLSPFPGLSLSSDGIISGTPTQVGTTAFTVQVTDYLQNVATRSISITIVEPSPCKFGNGIVKALNLPAKLLGRKGRFFYLNPK